MAKIKETKLGLPSHTESKGTGMENGSGLINKPIDPTLGGVNTTQYKTNSPKPKQTQNLKIVKKSKSLKNQSGLLTPKFGLMRMQRNRLANINAIPGTPQSITPGGGSPPSTPATTSVREIITQAGDVLVTQAGVDLITQQQ